MPPLPKVMMMGGATLLMMGTLGGFYFFPKIIDGQVDANKAIKKGTLIRDMFENFPFPLSMKVFMFNVTNPQAVMQGEKPIVQEIGPFVFDEYKSKVELKDRNKDDTVLYKPVNKYFYNQRKSGSLTGNEIVTVPNIFLLTMVMTVEREHPGMLGMINKAVNALYKKPDTIYANIRVMDLLFDGVKIDCRVKEFAGKAVCTKLKDEVGKNLVLLEEDVYAFSIFGLKNGTAGDWVRVNRGSKNATLSAKVLEFKKQTHMSMWGEEGSCNNFTGTDGSVFQPRFTKETVLEIFAGDICRAMSLNFDREDEFKGIPTYVYKGNFGDIPSTPSLHCYCFTNTTCPKRGSFDLAKCNGSPIVLSLPHFYLTDDEYRNGIIGLKDGGEHYEFFVHLEPVSGSPLFVQFPIQFNVGLHAIPKVDVMKNLNTVMHPILFIEEGIVIPDKFIAMIGQLMMGLTFVHKGKWVMTAMGIGLLIASKVMSGKQKTESNVTPVEPFEADSPTHKKIQAFINDSNIDPWKLGDSAMIRY